MTDPGDDPKVLAKVRQALRRRNERRSPLSDWMWRNHDAFAAELAGAPPNWEAVAEAFTEVGFRSGTGGVLSAERVRKTWWRVRRRHEEARAGKTRPRG